MLSYTYLYEDGMITNKQNAALFRKGNCLRSVVGKEKSVALIKSLFDV